MRPFCLMLLLAASPAAAAAQLPPIPPPSAPPESVATAFLAHLQAYDWVGATAYFDPAEVTRFGDVFRRFSAMPGASQGMAQALGVAETELQQLTPEEIMAKFLALGAKANPDAFAAMRTATYQVVGRVTEDSGVAHVVLRGRMTLKGVEVSAAELRSFRRTPQGWRLQMPPELQGVLIGLESAMSEAK